MYTVGKISNATYYYDTYGMHIICDERLVCDICYIYPSCTGTVFDFQQVHKKSISRAREDVRFIHLSITRIAFFFFSSINSSFFLSLLRTWSCSILKMFLLFIYLFLTTNAFSCSILAPFNSSTLLPFL